MPNAFFRSALIIRKRSFGTKFHLGGGSRRGTLLPARKQFSYAFFGPPKPAHSLYPIEADGSTFRPEASEALQNKDERRICFILHPSSFILFPWRCIMERISVLAL